MVDTWEFEGPYGNVPVRVASVMSTNSGDTCRALALRHCGIILQPTFLVGEDLRKGALVEILPHYRSVDLGIYALYASRQHVAPKVRVLIDYLVSAFRTPSWD